MPIVNKVGKKLPRTKAFVLYKSIKAKFPIDVIKDAMYILNKSLRRLDVNCIEFEKQNRNSGPAIRPITLKIGKDNPGRYVAK